MRRQAVCGGLPAETLSLAGMCGGPLPLAAQVRALGVHARFMTRGKVERIFAAKYKFVTKVSVSVRIPYLREGRKVAKARRARCGLLWIARGRVDKI